MRVLFSEHNWSCGKARIEMHLFLHRANNSGGRCISFCKLCTESLLSTTTIINMLLLLIKGKCINCTTLLVHWRSIVSVQCKNLSWRKINFDLLRLVRVYYLLLFNFVFNSSLHCRQLFRPDINRIYCSIDLEQIEQLSNVA